MSSNKRSLPALSAIITLVSALTACSDGSSGTGGGGAGTGAGGTTGTDDCGVSYIDCTGCNGGIAGADCRHGHWTCDLECKGAAPSWAKSATGQGSQAGSAVAVASDGSVFVGGSFGGTIDLGGETFTTVEPQSAAAHDAVVAKLAADGTLAWARAFGAAGDDRVTDIGVDSAGNAVVVGTYEKDQSIGSYAIVGANGLFVIKIDPKGDVVFAKGFTGASGPTRARVEVTPAGDILLAGETGGTIDFGGGPLAGGAGRDAFVARLGPNGDHVFSRRFSGTGDSAALDLALWPNGDVAVVGMFQGSLSLGTGTATSKGGFDAFYLRLDASGATTATATYGGPGEERPGSVVIDPAGNVVFTSSYGDQASFGLDTLTAGPPQGVLVSTTPDGETRWQRPYTMVDDELTPYRLAIAKDGDLVLAGQFKDVFDLRGARAASAGGVDIVLTTTNDDFKLSIATYGGAGAERVGGVATDPQTGDVLLVGTTWGTLDLGLGALPGGADGTMFWARFAAK